MLMNKIAVCTGTNSPTAIIDGRFGRCAGFMIFDEQGNIEYVVNPAVESAHGAGTGAVQELVKKDVGIVIATRVGPKAFSALQEAGVKIYAGAEGNKAEDEFRKFLNQELTEILSPSK